MRVLPVIRISSQEMASIEQAISFLEQHFSEKISADDLSQQFLVPARKLQAGFRKKTGHTVHDHLLAIRLEQAKIFLAGDGPLKSIHSKVGYKNASHFGQFFKKHTGITPAEYRLLQQT